MSDEIAADFQERLGEQLAESSEVSRFAADRHKTGNVEFLAVPARIPGAGDKTMAPGGETIMPTDWLKGIR